MYYYIYCRSWQDDNVICIKRALRTRAQYQSHLKNPITLILHEDHTLSSLLFVMILGKDSWFL